jgi:hypothetical protein
MCRARERAKQQKEKELHAVFGSGSNPDPDQMNTDPKHWLLVEAIGVAQSGLAFSEHISKYLRY